MTITFKDLIQQTDYIWEIPASFRDDMRVPARILGSRKIVGKALQDRSIEQLVNATTLPGIVGYALAMPDVHQGYGFPVGGVAATRMPTGVAATWLMSTSIPTRFISRTTSSPKGLRPPWRGSSVALSAQAIVLACVSVM